MEKLTILMGRQRDGYVFRLKPSSKKSLQQTRGPQDTVSSVFISYDTKHEFERIHEWVWDHVITLLTGMSSEEVDEAGGFVVVDPATAQTRYDSVSQHV